MKALVLLLLVSISAVMLFATAASASDDSWLIDIKAVSPDFMHGGVAVSVGVGTKVNQWAQWSPTTGITAQAEFTPNYSDLTGYHARHDVVRSTEGKERYLWDLKIGARADYQYSTINICLWNKQITSFGAGGELNHGLAYVFAKNVSGTDQVLAWFTDSSIKMDFQDTRPGMSSSLWHDTSVLLKNASTWTPTSSNPGFYVTDTVTKGTGFSALGDYRLYAFDQSTAQNWIDPLPMPADDPVVSEPTSLLALASGLLGAAGVALRRRRA